MKYKGLSTKMVIRDKLGNLYSPINSHRLHTEAAMVRQCNPVLRGVGKGISPSASGVFKGFAALSPQENNDVTDQGRNRK